MHVLCKISFADQMSCQDQLTFLKKYRYSCEKTPPLNNKRDLTELSMATQLQQCEENYVKNQCADLEKILPPEEHHKIARCSEGDLCKSVGQATKDVLIGCPMGGVDYVVGVYNIVKDSINKVVDSHKEEQNCSTGIFSMEHKQWMFALYNDSVPTALRLKVPPKEALEKMRCNEIRRRLFETTHDISRRLSAEYDRAVKLKQPLSKEVQEFIAWEENNKKARPDVAGHLMGAAKELLRELNIKAECYNIEAYTEMVCRAVLQTALGVYEFSKIYAVAGLTKRIASYPERLQQLIRSGKLSEEGATKVIAAEKSLRRPLTTEQMVAVEKAHLIGTTEGRVQRLQGAPIEKELTNGDIKRKIRTLEAAGFTRDDVVDLLDNRILGQALTTREARTAVTTNRLAAEKAGASGNIQEMTSMNSRAADAMEVVIQDAKYAKSSRDYAEAARLNAHAERYDKAASYYVKSQESLPSRERVQAIYEALNREKAELRAIAAKNANNPTYRKYYEDHRKLIESVLDNSKLPFGEAWKNELLKP